MLTGETRPFKGGNFDRVSPVQRARQGRARRVRGGASLRPARSLEHADLARAGNEAQSLTLGLNWYFNPYAKLMFNWVRFSGDNTPLDPDGSKTEGDAFATRLHFDF